MSCPNLGLQVSIIMPIWALYYVYELAGAMRLFGRQTRRMPVAGLGTWLSSEAEADDMVDAALEAGIRLIDNSILYENEAAIGKTLKRWVDTGRLKRRELFVASKLPIMGMEPCLVEFYVDMSLRNLGLDYFDLYLIHTPFGIERDDASGGFKMVDGKVDPFSPQSTLSFHFPPTCIFGYQASRAFAFSMRIQNSTEKCTDRERVQY